VWAWLQLQEPADYNADESPSAATSIRHKREIVDYVVTEHAPWALRLVQGVRGFGRLPEKHLEILVRFLQSPGVAEIVERTNNFSASQFCTSSSTLSEQWENTGGNAALSAKDWHDMKRWHSTVLPTLSALQVVLRPRCGCAAVCSVRKQRDVSMAERVAEWSTNFLQAHPEMPAGAPSTPASGLGATINLPPLGAEDELSECDIEQETAPSPASSRRTSKRSHGSKGAHDMGREWIPRVSVASGSPVRASSGSQARASGGPSSVPARAECHSLAFDAAEAAAHEQAPLLEVLASALADSRAPVRGATSHGWDQVDHSAVSIRGANYLQDKVKVTSQPSLLELLCVDLCEVEDPKGVPHISAHANSVVQRLRSVGERRFLFTVNWRFPPRQFVIVFASPSPGAVGAAWPEGPGASSAAGELLRRFVEEMDDKASIE
jgi:hypothetical protein